MSAVKVVGLFYYFTEPASSHAIKHLLRKRKEKIKEPLLSRQAESIVM
jgi:hypothetical protein